MERKFSSDLEIPKYLKRKENDISKANKKSKHKHQYEECLIRYKWNWDEHKIHTSLNSYCTICGKINDKMKNSIVIDRKSTRLNSSHITRSRMPSSA